MAMTHKEIKQRYFDRVYAEAPLVECACGCGEQLKSKDRYGRDQKYINGHNGRKYDDSKEYLRVYSRKIIKRSYEFKRNRRRRLKAELIEKIGGKCLVCGFLYDGRNAAVFDFHHRDPSTKSFALSSGGIINKSWALVLLEVEKCDLVCRRCHGLLHHPVLRGRYGELKRRLIERMGEECAECGFSYDGLNGAAFDFHHRVPDDKMFRIGGAISDKKWEELLIEIQKCDLLCGNCHRMKHSEEC